MTIKPPKKDIFLNMTSIFLKLKNGTEFAFKKMLAYKVKDDEDKELNQLKQYCYNTLIEEDEDEV